MIYWLLIKKSILQINNLIQAIYYTYGKLTFPSFIYYYNIDMNLNYWIFEHDNFKSLHLAKYSLFTS